MRPAKLDPILWGNVGGGTSFIRLPPALLAGDYNNNGTVDAADYVVWCKNDGLLQGYADWRASFGRTAGGGTFSNATIPEPANLLRLLTADLPTLNCRHAR